MKKQILILSGPTHEYIDPVRFIGNASSGKMGKFLAEEAARRGYKVEMVSGPVAEENMPQAEGISLHRVTSAEEMLLTAKPLFTHSNCILFVAAVADYTPAEKLTQKKVKSSEEFLLRLRPTPDIAQQLCAHKKADQVAIGFALQTEHGEEHARRKLKKKHLDGIVLNTPTSLGASDGLFSYLSILDTAFKDWGRISKKACAQQILDAVQQLEISTT